MRPSTLAVSCRNRRPSASHTVNDLLQYIGIRNGSEVPILPIHGAGGVDAGGEDLIYILLHDLVIRECLDRRNAGNQLSSRPSRPP